MRAFLAFALWSIVLNVFADDRDIVLIDHPTNFQSFITGATISVPPGLYRLEASDHDSLRIVSRTGGPNMQVGAVTGVHDGHTETPVAISEKAEEGGALRLSLYLPGGVLLRTLGSPRDGDMSKSVKAFALKEDRLPRRLTAEATPIGKIRSDVVIGEIGSDVVFGEGVEIVKPFYVNSVIFSVIERDAWSQQDVKVYYRFEDKRKCVGNTALIRATQSDNRGGELYASTSAVVALQAPAGIPNRGIPQSGQHPPPWLTNLSSVLLTLSYRGFVPANTQNWRVEMDCAEYAPGEKGPLATHEFENEKWWAFDPPNSDDWDSVPDAAEDMLIKKFAPEVRLSPNETAFPSSVDWYLSRVNMRFHHTRCSDCEVVALPNVTQSNISTQEHHGKNHRCKHNDEIRSSRSSERFFLQPNNDSTHKGGSNTADWRAYARVNGGGCGYVIQYWFFYPYNDAFGTFNHEGDWEQITVYTNAVGEIEPMSSVYFAQHDGGKSYRADTLNWVDGTHPVVYSARGTHASYPKPGSFDIPLIGGKSVPGIKDETRDGGRVWKTWTNVINVGEADHILNNQQFILYGGRWGEIGQFDFTSGPRGPAFHSNFSETTVCGDPSCSSQGMKNCSNKCRHPGVPKGCVALSYVCPEDTCTPTDQGCRSGMKCCEEGYPKCSVCQQSGRPCP